MNNNLNFKKALELFEKQINCIMSDDRKAQMELYAEDLRYEFPFANDLPRLIESREAFLAVMTPLWEEAYQRGVKVIGFNHEFHSTDEIDLFVAVFDLEVIAAGNTMSLPFVQLIRIRDDLIVEVREYFSPTRRQEVVNQH
jgi:ketosteroid isomerase-like protein